MNMKNFLKTIAHKRGEYDPVTSLVSGAAQENEVAAKKLDEALKSTVDRPENALEVRRVQSH